MGSSSLCVVHLLSVALSLWAGMRTKTKCSPGPGVRVLGVALTVDDGRVVSAAGSAIGFAPIVVGEAEVGMAGPTVTSKIYQSRASR